MDTRAGKLGLGSSSCGGAAALHRFLLKLCLHVDQVRQHDEDTPVRDNQRDDEYVMVPDRPVCRLGYEVEQLDH